MRTGARGSGGGSVGAQGVASRGPGNPPPPRRLAPAIEAIILESDAMRRLLFEAPEYTAVESFVVFRSLYGAARELLSHGVLVIIDATNVRRSDRRPLYALVNDTGTPLFIAQLEAPPAGI